MSRIYIVQALCPQRHAIAAVPAELKESLTESERQAFIAGVMKQVDAEIARRAIDPWCGLCVAPRSQWSFEMNATKYRTMEEAWPALKQLEREQQETREYLLKLTRHAAN